MQTDRRNLRLALERVAFAQSGLFTAAQALEAGYSYQAQKYHADAGNWVRIDRALFRLPHWPAQPDEHLVRLQLRAGADAVFSHATALALHGLSDANPATTHLTLPPGRSFTERAVDVHHDTLGPNDVEERGGWRVTTPLRTLVDAAGDASLTQEIIDRAVADGLERGLTTRRRLRRSIEGAPDSAALRVERALGRQAERSTS